ncbi:hypothetical protein L226DRAFT_393521 [Lentinus tigrinus ALCF2SS1-7]|uniref:uncharacterized protein n=1 Tax=Lentinus tigrinus ALCF2SS1-7 TaxID=1328758 RepID=UPI001165F8A5|nr:hypothetical protein L226DRAFT_393521 [Lentinus tigrinus ALCF2SS1-7]
MFLRFRDIEEQADNRDAHTASSCPEAPNMRCSSALLPESFSQIHETVGTIQHCSTYIFAILTGVDSGPPQPDPLCLSPTKDMASASETVSQGLYTATLQAISAPSETLSYSCSVACW